MARLYWRVKKNGRWTWKPAVVAEDQDEYFVLVTKILEEEE